jgi:glycine cleavage system H protein
VQILEDTPGTVNESPMEKAWFIKIKISNPSEVEDLMNETAYNKFISK